MNKSVHKLSAKQDITYTAEGGILPCAAYPSGCATGFNTGEYISPKCLGLIKYIPFGLLLFSSFFVFSLLQGFSSLSIICTGLLLLGTMGSAYGAINLFFPQDDVLRPARIAAGFLVVILTTDYWLWYFGDYSGNIQSAYLIVSELLRLGLLLCLFMFLFYRLHVTLLFVAVLIKGILGLLFCLMFFVGLLYHGSHPLGFGELFFYFSIFELGLALLYLFYLSKLIAPANILYSIKLPARKTA